MIGVETLTTGSQSDTLRQALASESAHWYDKHGNPVYEVPYADPSKGMRPTMLSDARKLNLFPSVTKICKMAAQPGLEIWKATQILEASLTLPIQQGETVDAYALRVVEDSKAQSQKAMDKGKELHTAIEDYIKKMSSGTSFCVDPQWDAHLDKLWKTMNQYGINLSSGKQEHSFASPSVGYGGKIDWHNSEAVLDFKTKDKLTEVVKGKVKDKKLAWPENVEQLAAYARGLHFDAARLINVYIGIEDMEIRIHEWTRQDHENGWAVFEALLKVWQIRNNYTGQNL